MTNCNVFRCKKRSETSSFRKDKTTFHRFPQDAVIRAKWVQACGNHCTWVPTPTSTVCSQHFEPSCFILRSNNRRRLKENAVPTLNLSEVALKNSDCEPDALKKRNSDTLEDLQSSHIQDNKTGIDMLNLSDDYICTSPDSYPQLKYTPREKKLKEQIRMKNKLMKRLRSQNTYLKKRVTELQEILDSINEKSLTYYEE